MRILTDEQRTLLLSAFPNSEFCTIRNEYSGHSGAPVLAVLFYAPESSAESPGASSGNLPSTATAPASNRGGLNGLYIVKIGSEAWAKSEEAFYTHPPAGDALIPSMAGFKMRSDTVDGLVAVAYDIAFDADTHPRLLRELLNSDDTDDEAHATITHVTRAMGDWYAAKATRESIVIDAYDLFSRLLGQKRLRDVGERMHASLPHWQQDIPQIRLVTSTRRIPLPNPLSYVRAEAWKKLRYDVHCPVGHIHGDLHTGNIIVGSGAGVNVRLIDCEPIDEATLNGVPLFDLAYLEFDIIRQVLPIEQSELRPQWLELLSHSMAEILPSHHFHGWQAQAARAWRLMQPIRRQVQRLIEIEPEYEMVWWLATAAVGLNYARKGAEDTRPAIERMACLIYAAFGLDQFLRKSSEHLERSKKHHQHVYRHANAIPWSDDTVAINGMPITL
jgi:hypothetical protein